MRLSLKLHPDCTSGAVTSVDVEVSRTAAGMLVARYRVAGRIRDLNLPALAAPARADGLWQHSCFEAFVASPGAAAYRELNFAPSGQWAAYRLSGYRSGMAEEAGLSPPAIETNADEALYELQAALDLGRLPDLPLDAPWRVGLSAVIEETSGNKSYWALAHPPGKPDFHHKDCFAIDLPPAA